MRTVLQPGKEYDFLTPQEMHKGLNDMQGRLVDALVREELRGIKYLKYTRNLNARTTPGSMNFISGPSSGYLWSLLDISSIPSTANGSYGSVSVSIGPHGDVLGSGLNTSLFDSEWGHVMAAYSDISFSKGQLIVSPENDIFFINNDTNNAMVVRVAIVEVPAEMIGKLYV